MAKTPAKQTGGKGTGNRKGTSQSTAFARSRLEDTLKHPAPNETIPALSDHYGDMDVWLDIIKDRLQLKGGGTSSRHEEDAVLEDIMTVISGRRMEIGSKVHRNEDQ